MSETKPLTADEIKALPARLTRPMTAREYRVLVGRLLETIKDLERERISAVSRLEWERNTHEAFVAVHHATCEKLSADLEEENARRMETVAACEMLRGELAKAREDLLRADEFCHGKDLRLAEQSRALEAADEMLPKVAVRVAGRIANIIWECERKNISGGSQAKILDEVEQAYRALRPEAKGASKLPAVCYGDGPCSEAAPCGECAPMPEAKGAEPKPKHLTANVKTPGPPLTEERMARALGLPWPPWPPQPAPETCKVHALKPVSGSLLATVCGKVGGPGAFVFSAFPTCPNCIPKTCVVVVKHVDLGEGPEPVSCGNPLPCATPGHALPTEPHEFRSVGASGMLRHDDRGPMWCGESAAAHLCVICSQPWSAHKEAK